MTIEEELALIKQNQSPAPAPGPDVPTPEMAELSATFQAAVQKPEAASAPPSIEDTDKALGLPPRETGLDPLPDDDAGTWDVMGAAWRAETIRTDAWNYTERLRRDLTERMWTKLPEDARQRIMDLKWDQQNNWMRFEDLVADELGRMAQSGPEAAADLAGLPLNREAFEQAILTRRRTELDEAQAVLDEPGGAVAEFIGAGARAMTDATSVMLLPSGLSGSAWRVIAGEAALGAAGEAAVLPREFQVAEELGEPAPDALARIGLGAVLGGGLAGAVVGGARIIRHVRERKAAVRAATPEGVDELDAEAAVDAAEAQMHGDETVAEVIGRTTPTAPAPGTLGDIIAGTGADFNEAAVLRQIIGVESGGRANAQAATSSARGLGQFIASTWLTMIEKHRPDLMEGRTQSQILELRDDPQLNAEMTLQFMRDNRAALQARGLPSGPGETYLAHFMGVGGATRALSVPLETPISQIMDAKAIAANRGIRYKGKSFAEFTAFDLIQWAKAKMRKAYDPNASSDMPTFTSSRGYTGAGQVRVSDDLTIDVEYVVVDASSLTRASGDFQPRDRSRVNSDAWIADTAARLDPAQLMPSPNAATGAPIVGPDGMIESGNGRFGVIERAYERHPDRIAAYRKAIEDAGFAVPEGVTRPVLVAQRRTELTRDQRIQMTIDAQDSGVAQMTPTEVAMSFGRAMTGPRLALFNPAAALTDEANGEFVRGMLKALPKSARNAMVTKEGALNRHGQQMLREAIFARAWDDPDLVELFIEADPEEIGGLLKALEQAVPEWAALKADIEAGAVRPEFDISGHVLDAIRLINAARTLAKKDGIGINKALNDLLDQVDILTGPVAPLTTALVKKFWAKGRAAPTEATATFLTRYATDARKAGQAGDMFGDGLTPRDVLQKIDPDTFGDLPADLGPVRGFARPGDTAPEPVPDLPPAEDMTFDAGAQGPEAEDLASVIREDIEGGGLQAEPLQTADQIMAGFTPNGPRQLIDFATLQVEEQGRLGRALKDAQPYDTAEAVHAAAIPNHDELNRIAAEVAAELGLDFKTAPVKKLDRIQQKVTDKYAGNFRKIADVARTGITAPTIEAAEAFVAGLARRFHLIDEGWAVTPAGYFDRKLMVRFDDGQLGEVQIWPPGMLDAKSNGGHKLYEISRDEAAAPEARAQAVEDMKALYGQIRDQLDPSFAAKLGFDAPAAARTAATSPAETSTARSSATTSSAVAREGGDQAAPVQTEPRPSGDTAANSDRSNLNSFMGGVLSRDTQNMGSGAPGVKASQEFSDFLDAELDLGDGTKVRARDLLDDLDADAGADAVLQACGLGGGA